MKKPRADREIAEAFLSLITAPPRADHQRKGYLVVLQTHSEAPVDPQVESSNVRSWKEFAELIGNAWRKPAAAILETAQYLREAKEELPRDQYESLAKFKLPFDSSAARKLLCIADKRMICAHGHKLPPAWTTIYELSKLADDVLEKALADGSIHPGMERRDAIALRKTGEQTAVDAADSSDAIASTDNSTAITPSLVEAWQAASPAERGEIIQSENVADIVALMSDVQRAALYDRIIGLQIARSAPVVPSAGGKKLLANLTGTFHWALGQEDPSSGAQALKIISAKLAANKRSAKDIGFAFMKNGKH
jgi:hypothetical protein